ncbi:MAG: hypothetical protein A2284_06240 [Deltaproteobacteria bacterium RIFOXYA12_FULL_61_11]|nr:MAG: hypothetical protein A2284_06240 [Deltaproteobacteria bacterium RIFOXYA12_FULL_61_11]
MMERLSSRLRKERVGKATGALAVLVLTLALILVLNDLAQTGILVALLSIALGAMALSLVVQNPPNGNSSTRPGKPGTTFRVLVLDDDTQYRRHLADLAVRESEQGRAIELVDCATEEEACNSLASGPRFDLALLDYDLGPEVPDGLTVLRHLLALDPELPVVLHSSLEDVALQEEAVVSGASLWEPKPLRRGRLLELLSSHGRGLRTAQAPGLPSRAVGLLVLAGEPGPREQLRQELLRELAARGRRDEVLAASSIDEALAMLGSENLGVLVVLCSNGVEWEWSLLRAGLAQLSWTGRCLAIDPGPGTCPEGFQVLSRPVAAGWFLGDRAETPPAPAKTHGEDLLPEVVRCLNHALNRPSVRLEVLLETWQDRGVESVLLDQLRTTLGADTQRLRELAGELLLFDQVARPRYASPTSVCRRLVPDAGALSCDGEEGEAWCDPELTEELLRRAISLLRGLDVKAGPDLAMRSYSEGSQWRIELCRRVASANDEFGTAAVPRGDRLGLLALLCRRLAEVQGGSFTLSSRGLATCVFPLREPLP